MTCSNKVQNHTLADDWIEHFLDPASQTRLLHEIITHTEDMSKHTHTPTFWVVMCRSVVDVAQVLQSNVFPCAQFVTTLLPLHLSVAPTNAIF